MLSMFDPVGDSIKKCPFLQALVVTEGESFARGVAENFSKTEKTVRSDSTPLQRLENVAVNFSLFHGKDGILPLKNRAQNNASTCRAAPRLHVAKKLPVASISLSGFWGDFNPFRFRGGKKKPEKPSRKDISHAQSHGPSAGGGSTSGQCPMRRILGPFATAVMSQRYHCPKPIVMMRAALARNSMVRALRPESIEIKLMAVAMASTLLNIPFGMLREHTQKFSPQWFLVVHATIPFIAMFRKAIVMPPYAIAFTIAAAIGGQAIGAKAEKRRQLWLENQTMEEPVEGDNRLQEWAVAASLTTPRLTS